MVPITVSRHRIGRPLDIIRTSARMRKGGHPLGHPSCTFSLPPDASNQSVRSSLIEGSSVNRWQERRHGVAVASITDLDRHLEGNRDIEPSRW
jgi:hypothetical protein